MTWLFQVKYVKADGTLVDFGGPDYSYCTAHGRTQTSAMSNALAHIKREQRRNPGLGWEVHSITFAAATS